LGAVEVGSRLRAAASRILKPPEEITKQAFKRLSLRSLFVYLGPSLIVSMAYMDPGNYGTDIQSGASFAYDLLWTVWLANLMAMILQYLSGKLGIATGKSLPELIKISLKTKKFTVPYWLAAEAAAAATDLAEYLGTVIALNLLFNIPLIYASIFGALDVIILLALTHERFRIIEYFFMLFVSIISIGFLYQVIIIQPSVSNIAYHSFAVSLNKDTALLVVGIVGATVMPHALFVHSWLTRNKLTTGSLEEKRKHRRLHLREVILTLTVASFVNIRGNSPRFRPCVIDDWHVGWPIDHGWVAWHPCEQVHPAACHQGRQRVSNNSRDLHRTQPALPPRVQSGDSQPHDTAADDPSHNLHEKERADGRVCEQEDNDDTRRTSRGIDHHSQHLSTHYNPLRLQSKVTT